jgi:hypothetical protein
MVLSEDDRKKGIPIPEPTESSTWRKDWLGLLIWLIGFLFLAILAIYDMVASLFR